MATGGQQLRPAGPTQVPQARLEEDWLHGNAGQPREVRAAAAGAASGAARRGRQRPAGGRLGR